MKGCGVAAVPGAKVWNVHDRSVAASPDKSFTPDVMDARYTVLTVRGTVGVKVAVRPEYPTVPAIGPDGDFLTAPTVSQMFGELVAVWLASRPVPAGAKPASNPDLPLPLECGSGLR